MAGRPFAFEDIPGTDPGALLHIGEVSDDPVFIAARAKAGAAIGTVMVNTGGLPMTRSLSKSGSFMSSMGSASYTDVVCEPPDYPSRLVNPYDRGGDPEYAGFALADANEFLLGNGGRLLADRRATLLGVTVLLQPSREARSANEVSSINRIAPNLEEASLVLHGIGLYMGLNEPDAELFARVALDFHKIHEGGRPAAG